MKVERWLFCLDFAVWLHGATGLVYTFILDETETYALKFPEFYYLLLIYMFSAVICFTYKVLRYLYLFRHLPTKIEAEERILTQM